VELTHTDGPGLVEPLCQLEGVLSWNADPSNERLALEVDDGAIGSLLRTALDQGWSVEFVGPYEGKEHP
jgi:hypothetical protein